MPQFPGWKLPTATVQDAAANLAARGRQTTDDVGARVGALASALAAQIRERMNPLGLATKSDVEVQTRLARARMSIVLQGLLDQQREHERELLDALRADLREELREELQTFAAAIDDNLFAIDEEEPSTTKSSLDLTLDDLEDLDEVDELEADDDSLDDLDLVEREPYSRDEYDFTDDGMIIRSRGVDTYDD